MEQALGNNQITLIRQFVQEIEGYQSDIDGLNDDKKEAYKRAEDNGLNKKALKIVVQERRRDAVDVRTERDLVDLYTAALDQPQEGQQLNLGAAEPKGPPQEDQQQASAAAETEAGEGGGPGDSPSEDNGTPAAEPEYDPGEDGPPEDEEPSPAPAPARARESEDENSGDEDREHDADEDEDLTDVPAFLKRGTSENEAAINGEGGGPEPTDEGEDAPPEYEDEDEQPNSSGSEVSEADPSPSAGGEEAEEGAGGGSDTLGEEPSPAIPGSDVDGLFGDD